MDNNWRLSLYAIMVCLAVFFIATPLLFSERCSWGNPEQIIMPVGIGQIVGPTIMEECSPPLIAISGFAAQVVGIVWLMVPIITTSCVVIIVFQSRRRER